MADESDIISREDLNSNKNIFMEQQLYAIKIGDIYNADIKKRLLVAKKVKSAFPAGETIYSKDVVREMDPARSTKAKKKQYQEDNKTLTPVLLNQNKINTIPENKKQPSNETTSTSSKDDSTVLADIKIDTNEQCNIFNSKERSRFEFVRATTTDQHEAVEVPKFIKELIYKKVSRHKFTKNIPKSEDILYTDKILQGEYQNNNPWAQFLVENKTFNDDWEFIQDFEFINTLVLDKRQPK
jgi:hypothetical protein